MDNLINVDDDLLDTVMNEIENTSGVEQLFWTLLLVGLVDPNADFEALLFNNKTK